jgi:flagellar hook-length control protein FliK
MKVLTTKPGINHQLPIVSEKSHASQAAASSNFSDAILIANSGVQMENSTDKKEGSSQEETPQQQIPEPQAVNQELLIPVVLTPTDLSAKMNGAQHISDAMSANLGNAANTTASSAVNLSQSPKTPAKSSVPAAVAVSDAKQNAKNEKAAHQITHPANPAHASNTQHQIASSATHVTELMPASSKPAAAAESTVLQAADIQNNKYASALTQLGSFINAHTLQHVPAAAAHQDFNVASTTYTDHVKKIAPTDFETKVDFVPQSLDSAMKDTYKVNLKIYPPELGHVIAKIKVSKDNAELIILTETNAVKEIVEANLSQLRENFQRADINLTTIDVQTQTPQSNSKEQGAPNQQDSSASTRAENSNELNQQSLSSEGSRTSNSIIDTYA